MATNPNNADNKYGQPLLRPEDLGVEALVSGDEDGASGKAALMLTSASKETVLRLN